METIKSDISIILVDDEEILLDSLLVYLEDVGFRASGYTIPQEALKAIAQDAPDVCIVDLRMPGTNGEDLVKEIHAVAPRVRCMILTGSHYEISDELKLIGMSQEDIIRKPIHDYQEFFSLLSSPSQ